MKTTIEISHILVRHEYEAKDILRLLSSGMTFEAAARKFSKCSSSKIGGRLGKFKPGRFVEPFEHAIEDLKFDIVSSPVRTSFGYHLIIKKAEFVLE